MKYENYELTDKNGKFIATLEMDIKKQCKALLQMPEVQTQLKRLIIKYGTNKQKVEYQLTEMFAPQQTKEQEKKVKEIVSTINEEKVESIKPILDLLVKHLETILQSYQEKLSEAMLEK